MNGLRHWPLQNQARGSRLGSLYYFSTILDILNYCPSTSVINTHTHIAIPAALGGDSDVGVDVEVMPVEVNVETRIDGLTFGESVLHVIPVMT